MVEPADTLFAVTDGPLPAPPAAGGGDDLLGGLTEPQRRAVTCDAPQVCVLAAAGSGKTRVLTRRIAHRLRTGTADPGHVLALTFTRKAAGELQARLSQLGLRDRVVAGTFHAVAIAALRQHWADRGLRPPSLLERKARVLAPLVADRPALAGSPLSEVAGHLEWAQARLILPAELPDALRASGRHHTVPGAELAALLARYEAEKARRRLIDFDDVLVRAAEAMEGDPEFASAQRWRYRHLFVDEFQDLNPAQHRLLHAWLGPRQDLCVVGDPHQAIYGWNGADPTQLQRFSERWPAAEVIRLDDNHRCSPQVVRTAAAILDDPAVAVRSRRADGPEPTVTAYATGEDEARGVAAAVARTLREGAPATSLAVLSRTNAQARALAAALGEAGVPHRVPGSRDLLTEPVTTRLLDGLHRDPGRPARLVVADLSEAAGQATTEAERQALDSLAQLARQHRGVEEGDAAGLAAWIQASLARDRDDDGGASGVTVCSFHRAKGLEWEAVWVCGLEEGLVPIGRATAPAALDEERRLLYVALTRAASVLHLSWARRRRFGGPVAVPRRASPWLALIDPAQRPATGPDEVLDVDAWRARLADQRRRLAERSTARRQRSGTVGLPDADPHIVAALQRWRADAARASGVPAHVLLHDRTLEALASLAPATREELADVPGLGAIKIARHGDVLLELVARPARAG